MYSKNRNGCRWQSQVREIATTSAKRSTSEKANEKEKTAIRKTKKKKKKKKKKKTYLKMMTNLGDVEQGQRVANFAHRERRGHDIGHVTRDAPVTRERGVAAPCIDVERPRTAHLHFRLHFCFFLEFSRRGALTRAIITNAAKGEYSTLSLDTVKRTEIPRERCQKPKKSTLKNRR
jgi:hypothetical protein